MLPKYNYIVELIKTGSTIEAQEKIMELRSSALALEEENLELKSTITQLEEQIKLSRTVKWEKPHYWIGDGDDRDGPFCQRCFDVSQILVRMQDGNNDIWKCLECKSRVQGPNYKIPQVKRGVISRGIA